MTWHRFDNSPWFARCVFSIILVLASASPARGQTATYHLHSEASATAGFFQMKTAGPDAAILAVQSAQLRNEAPGEYVVKQLDTQAGDPGATGMIPAGSVVTSVVWMKKTSDFGTLFPRTKLHLNSAGGVSLCASAGTSSLTTTLVQYTLTCTTSVAITVGAADRFYLWTGVNMTVGPGNKSLNAELDIEGTLNGNYDSRIVVPLPLPAPSISGLSPDSGTIGTPVTISGSNFGASQGSSTVTFNGTAASPTSWSDLSIAAPVPPGATPGPVVVTVNGIASNGVTFTAIVGTVSGTVSRASDATPISGVLVEVLDAGVPKGSGNSGTGGAYTVSGLATGTYDVRATAQGYQTTTTTGVAVTAGSTVTVNFSLGAGPPITYVYDELGRLTGVIGSSGESAVYSYDATGNLLSISRQGATAVSIIDFTPNQGLAGAAVTVQGTKFSPTPSQNTVTFNGTAATVTSASATQIVTSVPSGATTGPISVTTPTGSATSGTSFVVPPDTITGSITPGGPPVTVTIPTVGQTARISFSGAAGQRVSLVISGVTIPESDVSVLKPDQTALVNPTLVTITGAFFDAQTLPVAGTYNIVVDPRTNFTGSVTLRLYDASDALLSITPGGPPVTWNATIPGQNARLSFNGAANQRISVVLNGVSIAASNFSISNPDGSFLVTPMPVTPSVETFIDTMTLAATGTYTILVDPTQSNVGSITVNLYDVVDATGTITPGGPTVTIKTTIPGQNARATFSGTAGQKVSLTTAITVNPRRLFTARAYLLNPDGSQLGITVINSTSCFADINCTGNSFLDTRTLPTTGTYTILVDLEDSVVTGPNGRIDLTLYDVVDESGMVTIGGPALTVNITVPGQNGNVTFSGTAGQQVTVRVTNNNMDVAVSLLQPDGTQMTSSTAPSSQANFNLATQTLPVTGTYSIRIDPFGSAIGSLNVAVTSP